MDGEAKFDTSACATPDRIVLDLSNTRLGTGLASKTFPVEDGYLRQIRIVSSGPTNARVLTSRRSRTTRFLPPNPFPAGDGHPWWPDSRAEKIMTR